MRSFVDLGLFLAAVALGIGSALPILAGARPTEIPLTVLVDGFASGDLASVAPGDVALYESLAVPAIVASLILLVAALFDSIIAGWIGAALAVVVCSWFAFRVVEAFGSDVTDNRSTVLTNQNGFVLMLSGTLVALGCCLVTIRASSGTSSAR